MLRFIDKIAGLWLRFRTSREYKKNFGEHDELLLHEVSSNQDHISIIGEHPIVSIFAEESISLLEQCGAESYAEFDFQPSVDHGLKPIRCTIQYADKFSPAQKAMLLEKENELLKIENEALRKNQWNGKT